MLFLHYLLCVCVQEKKESGLNSINHRIPASRKLSPPQTAIKCSVLRKWPIESMCVCVCASHGKTTDWLFFFCWSGWKIHVYGDKTNKYTVISAHFQQTGDPANLECHDILKGIVDFIFFFLSSLWWRMLTLQQERFQEKWLQTGIVLRENLHLLHICFCS